ncbi:hypothetical protein H9Q08_12290 [Chryseobacterium sp. PS-8]|uniref:Uncharacterized protein n=1 Tax=Chryseobacterium indicum TaxID=2766954 RepID=A0ABS9C8Q4_9FLAO|nr:hypothetical protein [Chryseobacterium sp. PS-8]MCF2220079.1 hypothetical protein [Chryseobacterium sp. PS-8]
MKNPLIKMNGEFALQSMVNFFIMIISIMLNSLRSGVKDNHETRIRTTDLEAVAKIIEEVKEVFYHSNLPERDIQFWGSQLYEEPIN